MNENVLSLERWDSLTPLECEAVARELSRLMPPPWQFTEVRLCQGAQNSHYIAFFDWNGNAFALIPGGEATLGYDRDNPFVLNEEQCEEWSESMGLSGAELDEVMEDRHPVEFNEILDEVMTSLRTVTIEPFLIEVEAKELGVTPIATDTLASDSPDGEIESIFSGNGGFVRHTWLSGETHRVRGVSCRETLQFISQGGFRFPTSDEWEYACAAGSRSFWHWGNEYPLHCFPKECKDWDLNLKPNAFGLYVATHPCDYEFCAEPEIMRGGDGGCALSGGEGTTMVWLSLSSAFYFDLEFKDDTQEHFGVHLRRVYSIPPGPD